MLDIQCSTYAPSMLAASALSNALRFFGKADWADDLVAYSTYTRADLDACRRRLVHLHQSNEGGACKLWLAEHSADACPEHAEAWERALQLFRQAVTVEL